MADEPGLWNTAYIIGGALATMVAGLFAGRKSGKTSDSSSEAQVLAASLVPHTEMRDLTAAVRESTIATNRVADLLERDEQRRHDEALVRDALRKRGIVE